LALGGGQWSDAHPGHFTPIKSSADWVVTTVSLDAVEKRRSCPPPTELNPKSMVFQPIAS